MSANHYSQMLCQLSYGETFASCLPSLHVTSFARLKYGTFSQNILNSSPPCLCSIPPLLLVLTKGVQVFQIYYTLNRVVSPKFYSRNSTILVGDIITTR